VGERWSDANASLLQTSLRTTPTASFIQPRATPGFHCPKIHGALKARLIAPHLPRSSIINQFVRFRRCWPTRRIVASAGWHFDEFSSRSTTYRELLKKYQVEYENGTSGMRMATGRTMSRAFSASEFSCGDEPGRCLWAGMSNALAFCGALSRCRQLAALIRVLQRKQFRPVAMFQRLPIHQFHMREMSLFQRRRATSDFSMAAASEGLDMAIAEANVERTSMGLCRFLPIFHSLPRGDHRKAEGRTVLRRRELGSPTCLVSSHLADQVSVPNAIISAGTWTTDSRAG